MHILVITQYFWPEEFRINDLVKNLKKKNYEIKIITRVPNYPSGNLHKEFKKKKK